MGRGLIMDKINDRAIRTIIYFSTGKKPPSIIFVDCIFNGSPKISNLEDISRSIFLYFNRITLKRN